MVFPKPAQPSGCGLDLMRQLNESPGRVQPPIVNPLPWRLRPGWLVLPAAVLGGILLLRAGFPGLGSLLLGHGLLTVAAVCFLPTPRFSKSSCFGDELAGASSSSSRSR